MLNKVCLQGRMCATPELRRTGNGTSVTSFTVAWSEKYKESEQKLFLPCVAWRNNAEFAAKWFQKGSEVIVEGQLTSRKWQDKEGNNRETVELQVDHMHFCGGKKESAEKSDGAHAGEFQEIESDGSLPF